MFYFPFVASLKSKLFCLLRNHLLLSDVYFYLLVVLGYHNTSKYFDYFSK